MYDIVNAKVMDLTDILVIWLQIVAVAARDLDRAKQFAKRHGVRSVYGSYEGLAADEDVGEQHGCHCLMVNCDWSTLIDSRLFQCTFC